MSDIGRVEIQLRDGLEIAKILGEVDVSNVDEIQNALETPEGASIWIIDLSETTYFDSAGIRMLFTIGARLSLGRRRLQIIAPAGGHVRRVLELTDLSKIADLHTAADQVGPPPE